MRIAFKDLPIGARFKYERVLTGYGSNLLVCVKVSDRKYRVLSTGQVFDKSRGVYVDCIENELRLAVLRARENRP